MVKESELVDAAKEIIDKGDLNTLTFKDVYKTLSNNFNCDLSNHKKMLKRKVSELVDAKLEQVDEDAKEDKPSETLKEEPEGQSPKIDPEDEKLAEKFSSKELQLQKLLLEAYQLGAEGGRKTRASTNKRKSPVSSNKDKAKKKKTTTNGSENGEKEDNEDEEKGESENNNNNGTQKVKKKRPPKLLVLSPALSEFIGEEEMTRGDVVKKIHAYVKEHNLQNPSDRRKIIFDEKLQAVFKCKGSDFFKINKLISKHLIKPEEIA